MNQPLNTWVKKALNQNFDIWDEVLDSFADE